jgi:hypothetical protein
VGLPGSASLLERISLTGNAAGQLSERWLQEALFAFPEALPVKEIDPHIGPLIPVGMEIDPADIVFVTPTAGRPCRDEALAQSASSKGDRGSDP